MIVAHLFYLCHRDAVFSKPESRKGKGGGAAALSLTAFCLQNLHDLFPQENMFGINGFVVMVVVKQPVVVLGPVFDLLEEVRQAVCYVVPGELEGDAGGGTVGEDVVHRPAVGVQASPGLCIFRL